MLLALTGLPIVGGLLGHVFSQRSFGWLYRSLNHSAPLESRLNRSEPRAGDPMSGQVRAVSMFGHAEECHISSAGRRPNQAQGFYPGVSEPEPHCKLSLLWSFESFVNAVGWNNQVEHREEPFRPNILQERLLEPSCLLELVLGRGLRILVKAPMPLSIQPKEG